MPQWKPPTDTNLPSVPPPGTRLSPHQQWVAKQLREMPERSPRQQQWLDATIRNQKGEPTDPRETVPKATPAQAESAAHRVGMGPINDPTRLPLGQSRSPMPSQAQEAPPVASSSRQNSMGVRRRRKVTEEEEEEFDANSQAHHPVTDTPPPPPPQPPPDSYEPENFGDDDDDDDDDFEEDDDDDEPEIERPRDRSYPPPRTIQPYDARTDVMIEKFGQVANQMIHVVKENSYMAQQSAAESRKAADMIRENANAMLQSMQENSAAMIRTFQENASKMMETSVKMVVQADARRDAAEASQLRAMETYQTALTREADARVKIAEATAAIKRAKEVEDLIEEVPAEDPEGEEGEGEETEGMIAGLIGKGIANSAGPIIDQVVAGVMSALGANGPKLNEENVKSIVDSTVKSMFESRRKAKAAAQSAEPPKP